MATASWVHAPQQARSQETLDRFVGATRQLITEKPFEEVTVADIVKRAERTVGSFYARFDDKYGVLYMLVDELNDRVRRVVHAFCDPERWADQPVAAYMVESVRLNFGAYRRSAPLFRAALCAATIDQRFADQRHVTLRFCADEHKAFLLTRESELGCANPSRAADRCFEMTTAALDHHLLFGQFTETSPDGDVGLVHEVADQCLRILGVDASVHDFS